MRINCACQAKDTCRSALEFPILYADDQSQALPRLAAELVARRPDLIYAPPSSAAVAATRATNTIPIVFATGADPVGAGLVMSLSNPGSNATGVITIIDSLAPKKLELLREIMPGVRRLGLIGDPNDPRLTVDRAALAQVTSSLGVTVVVADALNPASFDAGVASLIGQRVDAIMAVGSLTYNLRERLVELTIKQRVPVVGTYSAMVEAGAFSPMPHRCPVNCGARRARRTWWTRCSGAPSRLTFQSSSRPTSNSLST